MRDALYILQALALLLVLLRMSWLHLDDARPREFTALLAWWIFSLLTITAWNSPALHLAAWIFIAPAAWSASRELPMPLKLAAGAALLPAAACSYIVATRWGATENVALFTARCWIGIAFAAVFLASGFATVNKNLQPPAFDPLRLGIGAFFLVYCGGQQALAAFDAWPLLPVLVALSTLIWLALAWWIAPTPDAIFNLERLAFSSSMQFSLTKWPIGRFPRSSSLPPHPTVRPYPLADSHRELSLQGRAQRPVQHPTGRGQAPEQPATALTLRESFAAARFSSAPRPVSISGAGLTSWRERIGAAPNCLAHRAPMYSMTFRDGDEDARVVWFCPQGCAAESYPAGTFAEALDG